MVEYLMEYFPKVLVDIIDVYTRPEKHQVCHRNYNFIYYAIFDDPKPLKTLRVLFGITVLFDSDNGYSNQSRILNELNRHNLWNLTDTDKNRIIAIVNYNDREIMIT